MPPPLTGAPGSPASLRTANQRRVIDALRAHVVSQQTQTLSQADLARTTGLAPATVSNIVRELSQSGLITIVPGSGRRGTQVGLSRAAGLVAGVDFGHSHVAVAIGDLTGHLVAEERAELAAADSYRHGLATARAMLDRLLVGTDATPRSIGLGLPAPISDGVVQSGAILPGWVGINPAEVTAETFGVPVHIENDANLGALAEFRQGVAQGTDTSIFIKISSGVGAGLIVAGQLFRGGTGTAGEIGHLTIDDQGPLCRCGSRGCLEAYVSVQHLEAMLVDQLPGAGAEQIVEAAESGNVAAMRALEDAGLHLGWALASAVNLLNPNIVVVGGDVARAGEFLLEPVRTSLRRHALDSAASTPVVMSELGERASLVGAVQLAADSVDLVGPGSD